MTDEPKKATTKDDVKRVATDLIKMHGHTTSLDVKTELRNRGFWATQDEVALHMSHIYKDLNWKRVWTFNTCTDGHFTCTIGHYTYTSDDANKWWDEEEDEDKDKDDPLIPF